MKQRILYGWNFIRVLYVLLGGSILIQSAADGRWGGILFGGYVAAMGLFAFGCAGGNCYHRPASATKRETAAAEFEEIK